MSDLYNWEEKTEPTISVSHAILFFIRETKTWASMGQIRAELEILTIILVERERQPQLPVILHMARQTILRLSLPLVLITPSVFHPILIHSHCHCTPHVGLSIGKVKNITFEAQLRELSSPNCCYQFALCWLDISGRISPIVQAGLAGLGNDVGKQVGAPTWGSWGFVVQSELPGQHWQQTQDGERREERRRRRTATDGDQPWRFDLIMSRQ